MKPVGKKTMRALRIGEKKYKKTNLRITFTSKTKTSSVILKILKILIQNQVLPVNLYWNLSGKRREASCLYRKTV
jgi:hypothetical protein